MPETLQLRRGGGLAQTQRRQCGLGFCPRLLAGERVFAGRRQVAFRVLQFGRETLGVAGGRAAI